MAANLFKNANKSGIGTTLTTIYSPTAMKSMVLELDVANTSGATVQIDVVVTDSSANITSYLLKSADVDPGSALTVIGDGRKVVLEASDAIKVKSSAVNSVDVVSAILEDVQ